MNFTGNQNQFLASGTATTITFNPETVLNSSWNTRWTSAHDSLSTIIYSTEDVTMDYSYDSSPCVYTPHGASFLPALYALFFILGFIGNGLVLWVILQGVRLRTMTDVCLLNLALADMLLVCSLPFLAHHASHPWVFGDFMCKVVFGAYYVGFYSGIFFITLMSVDRYLAIVLAVYAMRVRTRKYGAIAAAVTWIAGFLASFPEVAFLKVNETNNKYNCMPVYHGHGWRVFMLLKMNIFGLLIPLVIMGFCYTQIVRRLLNAPASKKQAIRLVVIVIVVFFCCWTPYNVASFHEAARLSELVDDTCEKSKAAILTRQITEALAYSHSCLNPIIYVFVGQKFRRNLISLIIRSPCSLCKFMKNYLPRDQRASRTGSVYSQTTSMDERSNAM